MDNRPEAKFQHTAARRRLGLGTVDIVITSGFNTQPPEGGWLISLVRRVFAFEFQHTAARRRLAANGIARSRPSTVSTHSRPKAAGSHASLFPETISCFNTQPPEGGWYKFQVFKLWIKSFNTQPPEGGWANCCPSISFSVVSTHSRPKAAGPTVGRWWTL